MRELLLWLLNSTDGALWLLNSTDGALPRQDTGDAADMPFRAKNMRRTSTEPLDHSEKAMIKRALAAHSP